VRRLAALGGGLALVWLTGGSAAATDLNEAIAQAVAHEPGLQRAEAEADVARAQLKQAQASRLPSLSVTAQAADGKTDFGTFFGFGQRDMSPLAASVKLQQPLFAGGALTAGVVRAEFERDAAQSQARGARLDLEARVAEAYGAVVVAQEAFSLNSRQVELATELARQAGLRFHSGEISRTGQAQAETRAAEARAAVAQAQGELAQARAHFRTLVGQEPGQLEPLGPGPALPPRLDEALATAARNSPGLNTARAGAEAAGAGVRQARGSFLPELALVAEAGTQRDQFFPGYRADGYAVGVQARWTLFSSGVQSAKVAEAQARRRAAEASAAEVRLVVDERVVALWNAVLAADLMAEAARQQVTAAQSAEASLGHEVKVSAKPLIDLLDAQRETLSARTALARANAARVTTRYRLRAIIGQ
jgi:outer membrane protein